MKNRKNMKIGLIILLCVMILLVIIFKSIINLCKNPELEDRQLRCEYPDSGKYYCEELDATLTFSGILVDLLVDGKQVALECRSLDALFWGYQDNSLNSLVCKMPYYWNRETNEIEVTVEVFPIGFEVNKTYYFSLVEP